MEIHWGAFMGCSSLKAITIPDSVMGISDGSFSNCSSLETVIIPDRVTQIQEYAFANCSGLKDITIPGATDTDSFVREPVKAIRSWLTADGTDRHNVKPILPDEGSNDSAKSADAAENPVGNDAALMRTESCTRDRENPVNEWQL